MSRSNHSKRWWRNTNSSGGLYRRHLHMWGDDFIHKRKDREISRKLRNKLKHIDEKEIKEELKGRYV